MQPSSRRTFGVFPSATSGAAATGAKAWLARCRAYSIRRIANGNARLFCQIRLLTSPSTPSLDVEGTLLSAPMGCMTTATGCRDILAFRGGLVKVTFVNGFARCGSGHMGLFREGHRIRGALLGPE